MKNVTENILIKEKKGFNILKSLFRVYKRLKHIIVLPPFC